MRLIDADALIELLEPHGLGKGSTCGWHSGIIDIVIDEISKMPTIGGWISVKDRLPEHGKRYLIYATSESGKNNRITTAAYGGHFALSGRCAYWKVTHWMPLPEPPTDEQRKEVRENERKSDCDPEKRPDRSPAEDGPG